MKNRKPYQVRYQKKYPTLSFRATRANKNFLDDYCKASSITRTLFLQRLVEREIARLKREKKLMKDVVKFVELKEEIRNEMMSEAFETIFSED